MKQMHEFQREVALADYSVYFEMVRNFMGRSGDDDPTVIKGEERYLSHSDHTVISFFYSCQSILYIKFGDCEKGAKLAIERGDTYAKGIPGEFSKLFYTMPNLYSTSSLPFLKVMCGS